MTTKEEMVRFRAINVLWDCLERCDTTAEILDPVLGCLSNLACAGETDYLPPPPFFA